MSRKSTRTPPHAALFLLLLACAAAADLHFMNSESTVQVLTEDHGLRHELSAVTLTVADGTNSSTTPLFLSLTITCRYGSVSIAETAVDQLHATSLSCLSPEDQTFSSSQVISSYQTKQISAYTTLGEAQLILSSLVYEVPPPASCRLPRGVSEDLLAIQIQQVTGSSSSLPSWRAQQADDVCIYEPAASAFFRQLVAPASDANTAVITLERRLVLPHNSIRSSGAELIQISSWNDTLRYTQRMCELFPAIAISVDASLEDELSTQVRHYNEVENDRLMDVTLTVHNGLLQLRVASALINRMRVFFKTVELQLLDPDMPPVTAASFTLRGTLSDIQTFLLTVRYCGTSPDPKLSGVYFASDAMDVSVSVSGPCTAALGADGDLVKSYATVPIQVKRLVDLGSLSLVALLPKDANAMAAAASGLMILNSNQLWTPLSVQYAPGSVDDVTAELQLEAGDGGDDGVFIGVESNSLLALDHQQDDVSTYFQTITRTQSSTKDAFAADKGSFNLLSSHSSWLTIRSAELAVAFTTEQLQQAIISLLPGDVSVNVACQTEFETPRVTACTLEYRNVHLLRIPRVYRASDSLAATSATLSVSILREKPQTHADVFQRPEQKRNWCGLHVSFEDEKPAGASLQFTRTICELAQSCHLAVSQPLATTLSLESDQAIATAAMRDLALDGENLDKLHFFRLSTQAPRDFLISDVPCTFAYALGVQSTTTTAEVRALRRHVQLRAPKKQLAAALNAVRIYSTAFGVRLHNTLYVTLQETALTSTAADRVDESPQVTTKFDVIVLPNYQNLQLRTLSELVVREGSSADVNLSSFSLSTSWPTQLSASYKSGQEHFRWSIRSNFLSLVFENHFSAALASVIHRQNGVNELEMRGSIFDFQASMAAVSLGLSSELLRDKTFFSGTIEHQVVQLSSVFQRRSKVQVLTTSIANSVIAGAFTLGVTLSEGFYSAINSTIPQVSCSSTSIQRSDTMDTIAAKVLAMACRPPPVDFQFKREVQVIRVNAVYPWFVEDLVGSFTLRFLGKTSTQVSVQLTDSDQMRLKVLEVVTDAQLEVSRMDFAGAFEWRVTFGSATGRAADQITTVPVAIASTASFTAQTTIAQRGLQASDLILSLLFPSVSLRVRDTSPVAIVNVLSLEFDFGIFSGQQPSHFPDLLLLGSTLESSATHSLLKATMGPSIAVDKNGKSSAVGSFRMSIFGQRTDALSVDAEAADVEAAIRRLKMDNLSVVSVQRMSSSDRYPYLYNWTIEASHPQLLDIQVDGQALQTSAGIRINASRVARGTEALVGVDTLSIALSTMDKTLTIAQRDVRVRVEKTKLDLMIKLPLLCVSVARNQSVPIEGIILDGFEIGLMLEIRTKNGGSLALLSATAGQSEGHLITRESSDSLMFEGLLSDLNAVLRSHRLVYSSPVGSSALLDEIQLRLQSATSEATQVIPVEIVTSAEAPSLLLPVSQLTVDEEQETDIRGLKLFFSDSATSDENDYHALLRDRSQLTRMAIQARDGFLTFSSVTGRRHEANPQLWSSTWKRQLELVGSVGAVNAELSRLRYVSPLISNSSSVDEISFTTFVVDDSSSSSAPSSASRSFSMAVRIRRRPLVALILFNGEILSDIDLLRTLQNQRVSLRNTSIRAISSLTNKEDPSVLLDLSVSALYGTLALVNTSRNSALNVSLMPFKVRLVANASTLTRLMEALQFAPRRGFNGPDQILFRVQQEDSDAHSVEQTTGVLPVFVDRVDRLPHWIWTSSGSNVSALRVFNARPQTLPNFTISEEDESEEKPAAGGISVANFFEDDMILRATVNATTGTLLHGCIPTQTSDSSGRFGSSLTLEGRVQDLRTTLAGIKFQVPARRLPPHYYSANAAADQQREEVNVTVTLTNISRRLPCSSKRAQDAPTGAHEQPQTAVVAILRLEIEESATLLTWELRWKADREIITVNEDESKRIGDAFDLSAFNDYEGRAEMEFVTRSGTLYLPGSAAVAEVFIATANDSSSLKIAAENGARLQQIVSELFYAPESDFNGFEVIKCSVFGHESELSLQVQPMNDAPTIVFATNDSIKWFNSPKLLLPAFTVQDMDANDVFDVDIEATSGALQWFRTPTELFDGVTITGVNTPSLHIKTTLPRLNALFAQPRLRFTSDNSSGTQPLSVSLKFPPARGGLHICVHDGSAGVCEDLVFPILTFYELQVSRAPLKVSHHRPLNLSDVVSITHHHFEGSVDDEDDPVTLQIDTLNGVVAFGDQQQQEQLTCAADTYEGRSALFTNGVARMIRASSVECLNAVLATAVFLTNPFDEDHVGSEAGAHRMRAPAIVRFELFNSEMEMLASGSLDLEIVTTRSQFHKTRQLVVSARGVDATSSQPKELSPQGVSEYIKVADFALVEIQRAPDQEEFSSTDDPVVSQDANLMLELAFSCTHCRFFYAKYIPRVSYEFAATQGASAMRFIGPEAALNLVLAMLQVDLPASMPSNQEDELVRLTLSPYDFASAVAQDGTLTGSSGQQQRWNDTAEVLIARLPAKQSVLVWRIAETQLVFRDVDEGDSIFIYGVELSSSDIRGRRLGAAGDNDDMKLTVWLECVVGSSRITFASDNGPQSQLCEPNQSRIAISTSAKRANCVLSSVQVVPNASERVDLQFSFAPGEISSSSPKEEAEVGATLAPLLSLYFLLQTPLEPPTLVLNHETEALRAIEDETADLGDWVTIQAPRGSSSGYPSGAYGEDEWFVVSLVVHHGTIRVKISVCCVHIRSTSDSRNVSIMGTITTVQTALDAIRYRGDPDFSGNDTLHATIEHARVEDGGSATSSASEGLRALEKLIAVEPTNDPPVIQHSIPPPLAGEHNSSMLSYSLAKITISDVDVLPAGDSQTLSSRVRVNLSSTGGEFMVIDPAALARVELLETNGSISAGVQGSNHNSSVAFKQLVFEANVSDANALIRKTLFSTGRVSSAVCALAAQEEFTITVDDLGHDIETWTHLQTSAHIRDFGCVVDGDFDATAAALELTLPENPDDYMSYDQKYGKMSIAGLSIAGVADDFSSSLRVTGSCNFKVQLEIQRVSIIAPSQKQELLLTIWTPSVTGVSTVTGTFSIQVDVLLNGFHLKQTVAIYGDAVAMRAQELLGQASNGHSIGESIQAKLLVLYAPVIASIAIDQPLLRFHVDRVALPPSSTSAQWKISIFNSPMQLPTPQVLSQSLVGAGTGAYVSFTSSIIGAPFGGTFRLRLGDEVTRALPFDATEMELQDALEALVAVEMVKVTKPMRSASWLVTFFSPSESIPLLLGVSQGLAPSLQLSDADKGVTLVNGTSIRVERVSAGRGQGNLRNVVVGITRVDRVYRVATSADSTIKGSFALGFQDLNAPALPLVLLASTDAIAFNSVAMRLDEGQLQSFGGRRGDSMQSKLLLALAQLDNSYRQWKDVHVEITRGPQDTVHFGYEWLVTFKHAPPDFPALVVSDTNHLEGMNTLVQVAVITASVNQLDGFFQLSYRASGQRAVLIPADAMPDVVESVLNEALASSDDDPNASFLGRVVVRKAHLNERSRVGFSYGVLFLEELSSSFLPSSGGELLVADGSLLTGVGAFARVNELQMRSSAGSFELLAARRGFRDSSSRWSGDLRFQSLPDAFVLETESGTQLQLALNFIVFQAPANWYGTIQLQFYLDIIQSDSSGGSTSQVVGMSTTMLASGARRLSSIATAAVPLVFDLPQVEISNEVDTFAINATGGFPQQLRDFTIRLTGASAAITWLKLRLSCANGQFISTTRAAFVPLGSRTQQVWINGTLTHIHNQLQNVIAFVALRGSSALDRLTFSLFYSQDELPLAESEFLVRVSAPPVIPQLHIKDSIEGPFRSTLWQVMNMVIVHGDTLKLPGIWIGDVNSGATGGSSSSNAITLELVCDSGSLQFAYFDDHLLQQTTDASGKTLRLTLPGDLALLNRALGQLQYESLAKSIYRDHDTIHLSVRNDGAAPPFTHQRLIQLSIRRKVLVPRVILGSLTYTSFEDTGFRFSDLTLEFPADLVSDDSSSNRSIPASPASYYHQLWSTELVDPTLKRQYPQADSGDDWRHRWVQDFPGRVVSSPPGSTLPRISRLCASGNLFYFQGSDEAHGRELWVSDGSSAGTQMLTDLVPGPESSEPTEMTLLNGNVLFAASGLDLSWALGTDSCNGFRTSSLDPNVVYLVSKSSVWTPSADYDCLPGYRWMTTAEASRLFPTQEEAEQVDEWRTDHNLTESYVFWSSCQWTGYTFGGVQRKLFRFSDSRVSGATKHAGRRDSAPVEVSFATTDFAGIVCIKSDLSTSAGAGRELWTTDGTAPNTRRVLDLRPGSGGCNPSFLTLFKSQTLVVFQAETSDYGAELYKTDGTASGTISVEDIWRGPRSSSPSSFAEWTAGDGRMFFAATTDDGRELWATDGFSSFTAERLRKTPGPAVLAGTTLVRDVCAGSGSSDPQFITATTLGVFFSANDCVNGRELWITDGTTGGTRLVKDLNPIAGQDSSPSHLVLFSDKVYFRAQASLALGFELYVSDGTAAGTLLLTDLTPGSVSSYPSLLSSLVARDANNAIVSTALYFGAYDANVKALNLWKSDGSRSGTAPLLDQIFLHDRRLRLDASTGAPGTIFTFQNALYYFVESTSALPQTCPVLTNDATFQLNISVNAGRISSTGIENAPVPTSSLSTTGSFADLARVFEGLVYVPEQNWNFYRDRGQVVEWLFSVKHGNDVQETYADLLVAPRVDAPVIQVPTGVEDAIQSMGDFLSRLRLSCLPLTCNEDTPLSLRGLGARSADSGSDSGSSRFSSPRLLLVNLSVAHGNLKFSDTRCVEGFLSQPSKAQVAFTADVRCVNVVLASAVYVGEPHFSGSDALRVHVTDSESLASDDATIPLLVREVNDAPYLVTLSEHYECDEDIPLVIRDVRIVDPDIPAGLATLSVTIRAAFGSVALLHPSDAIGVVSSTTDSTTSLQRELTLRGTLWDVNSALSGLVFTSAKDWNSVDSTFDSTSDGYDSLTFMMSDALPTSQTPPFNSSTTSVRFVYVRPLADPVVINIPGNDPRSDHVQELLGTVHGDEDTPLRVHNLSFSSVDDMARVTLTVSFQAAHGDLMLFSSSSTTTVVSSGVTFLDKIHNGKKSLRFKGTFASLNRAVRELQYLPDLNFNGLDQILVSATTLDEYTMEESQETTLTISVTIDAVNDPPVWDTSSLFAGGTGTGPVAVVNPKAPTLISGIQIRDVDVTVALCASAGACVMDIVIEVAHGMISLPRLDEDQLTNFLKVSVLVQDPGYLALSGTLAHLNLVLRDILFTLDDIEALQVEFRAPNEVAIVLTVDDRGTQGKGDLHVSSTVVYVALASDRDQGTHGLYLKAPSASVIAIQEDSSFPFNGSLSLFDADVALSTSRLLEVSVSTLHGTFAFSAPVPGIQMVRNDSNATVFRGFLSQVNVVFMGSAYIPARDWYGSEQVSISVSDVARSFRWASAVVYFAVAPVCDEPTWLQQPSPSSSADNGAFATLYEDEKLLIDSLSLTSPDAYADKHEITVQIIVQHGGVMLATYQGLLLLPTTQFKGLPFDLSTFPQASDAKENAITESRLFFSQLGVRGRLSDVNRALRGLIYEPNQHFHSSGQLVDEIDLLASAGCGGDHLPPAPSRSSMFTVWLRIQAVNDPPVLLSKVFAAVASNLLQANSVLEHLMSVLPAPALEATEDSDLLLEPAVVQDPDQDPSRSHSPELQLLVNISCVHCSIRSSAPLSRLLEQHGLFVSSASHLAHVDFKQQTRSSESVAVHVLLAQGALASLNSAFLSSLVFRGALNFHGVALVVVQISDLGNFGIGGARTSTYAQTVRVKSIDDGPQIHLPPYGTLEPLVQVQEKASVLLQGAPSVDELLSEAAAAQSQQQSSSEPLAYFNECGWNGYIWGGVYYFGKAASSSSSSNDYSLGFCDKSDDDATEAPVNTRSITLFDVESRTDDAAQYQLRLNCSKGFVSLGRTCDGVMFLLGSQTGSVAIALQGTMTALNCVLERVTYHAAADIAGWDTVFVTLTQTQPTDGDGRFYAVTKRIPIEIRAVNDAPQIAMAATYFALLDAWVELSNMRVSDADAGDARVFIQLKVYNGQLRVVGREAQALVLRTDQGAAGDGSSSSSNVLEFAASVSEAPLIFTSLQYKCAVESACRDGTRDYLTLYVDDNGFSGDGGARDATATAVILVRSGA